MDQHQRSWILLTSLRGSTWGQETDKFRSVTGPDVCISKSEEQVCIKEHFHEKAGISKTCFYECALPKRKIVWSVSNSQHRHNVHCPLSREKDLTHTWLQDCNQSRDWNHYFVLLVLVFLAYIVDPVEKLNEKKKNIVCCTHTHTHTNSRVLGIGRILLLCYYGIWKKKKMGIIFLFHKFMIIWFLMQTLD